MVVAWLLCWSIVIGYWKSGRVDEWKKKEGKQDRLAFICRERLSWRTESKAAIMRPFWLSALQLEGGFWGVTYSRHGSEFNT